MSCPNCLCKGAECVCGFVSDAVRRTAELNRLRTYIDDLETHLLSTCAFIVNNVDADSCDVTASLELLTVNGGAHVRDAATRVLANDGGAP